MQFRGSSIDGAADCFSEGAQPRLSAPYRTVGDFFNTPLRIARLQRMLRRQGMRFGDEITVQCKLADFSVSNV